MCWEGGGWGCEGEAEGRRAGRGGRVGYLCALQITLTLELRIAEQPAGDTYGLNPSKNMSSEEG